MNAIQKFFLLSFILGISSVAIAQDSLSLETLQSMTYNFSIEEGQLVGEGADFLKKEIAKAQASA